ncbi:MAG TPA: SUMF1/EgtB/PvdO family nonheme iron enzyme, partial [Polyangiaceae bacterium]
GGSGVAGAGGSVNQPVCPNTSRGAAMVAVPVQNGAAYCVDRTEVTNAEYLAFLNSDETGTEVIPGNVCAWNTSFVPTASWPPVQNEANLPVVFVDWCDAAAYCAWAGKRLCGRVGGGAVGFDPPDTTESQWYRACSKNDAFKYPYGDEYEASRCNGNDYGVGNRVAAGSLACEGGYPGIEDMSGNVLEWDDSCASANGATDLCRVRGGSFEHDESHLRCDNEDYAHRQDKLYHVGIRCCADSLVAAPD